MLERFRIQINFKLLPKILINIKMRVQVWKIKNVEIVDYCYINSYLKILCVIL